MTVERLAVTCDVADVPAAVAFWGGLLRRTPIDDGDGVLLPGQGTQIGLRFSPAGGPRTVPDRLHLHLTSTSLAGQHATVQQALALGGQRLDVGQRPEEGHVVLADPDGTALCVIEPGNPYLERCGPLGEITCVGSREMGPFWSAALGWPLVWDRGDQTAVQSPAGGTKLSWDGPPLLAEAGHNRQRLVLTAADPAAQAERLATLGARLLSAGGTAPGEPVLLADPDGNEVILRPARVTPAHR